MTSSKSSIPQAWPVIIALGLIAVMIVAMFCVELLFTRHVESQVDEIVENTEQSIILLDDMRSKAQNLSEPNIDAPGKTILINGIASDARAYAPIATSVGEPEEWHHLQSLLERLASTTAAEQPTRDQLANEIDASVDRLVSINAKEGRERASTIHAAHGKVLIGDELIGGITIAQSQWSRSSCCACSLGSAGLSPSASSCSTSARATSKRSLAARLTICVAR